MKEEEKTKKVKKEIIEYKQSKPSQLELFEIGDSNKDKYSNTVELYDVIPKYYLGGVEKKMGQYLDILERDFKHRGQDFKINITPAALLDKESGKTIHYYPSQREELVEDALRRIAATKKKGIYLDNDVAVKFTLYELQQELKRMGHGYNINEIKEAIEICNRSILEIKSKQGDQVTFTSPIFPFIGMETSDEIEGGKNRVVVMFHPLVTKSIDDNTHRLINYEKLMSYKMALSRYIHKRISHYFTGASTSNPYKIMMTNLIRDSGMKLYARKSDVLKQVVKCLEELKNKGTLVNYEVNKIINGKNLEDAKLELYVSEKLVDEIIKANNIKNEKLKIDNSKEFAEKIENLRQELKDSVYGLTTVIINNILSKVRNNIEHDIAIIALKEAKNYILKQKERGKPCNAAAITKTALNEGWSGQDESKKLLESKEAKVAISSEAAKEVRSKPTKSDMKIWDSIKKELQKEFGEDVYNNWLVKLDLEFIDKNIIELLVPSKFLRDWIKREYLDKKGKKNIESVIKQVLPDITKVSISAAQN